jgi:hypothetical protein
MSVEAGGFNKMKLLEKKVACANISVVVNGKTSGLCGCGRHACDKDRDSHLPSMNYKNHSDSVI